MYHKSRIVFLTYLVGINLLIFFHLPLPKRRSPLRKARRSHSCQRPTFFFLMTEPRAAGAVSLLSDRIWLQLLRETFERGDRANMVNKRTLQKPTDFGKAGVKQKMVIFRSRLHAIWFWPLLEEKVRAVCSWNTRSFHGNWKQKIKLVYFYRFFIPLVRTYEVLMMPIPDSRFRSTSSAYAVRTHSENTVCTSTIRDWLSYFIVYCSLRCLHLHKIYKISLQLGKILVSENELNLFESLFTK